MLPEQEFFSLHCPHFDEIPVSQTSCVYLEVGVLLHVKWLIPGSFMCAGTLL
jgi:hypothetical protein